MAYQSRRSIRPFRPNSWKRDNRRSPDAEKYCAQSGIQCRPNHGASSRWRHDNTVDATSKNLCIRKLCARATPPRRSTLAVRAGCNLNGVVGASKICRQRQRFILLLRSNLEDSGSAAYESQRSTRCFRRNSWQRDNRRSRDAKKYCAQSGVQCRTNHGASSR